MTKKAASVPPVPPTGPAPDAPAGTKAIVFERSHPSYAYWPGNYAELADEHADLLLDGGFARPATEADAQAVVPTDETR